jgi:hypothetical protein
MQRTVLLIFIFTSLTIFLATMITNSGTGSESPQKNNENTQIDYSLIRKWGSNGTGDGQFVRPHDIAFDSKGYVYLSDGNWTTYRSLLTMVSSLKSGDLKAQVMGNLTFHIA